MQRAFVALALVALCSSCKLLVKVAQKAAVASARSSDARNATEKAVSAAPVYELTLAELEALNSQPDVSGEPAAGIVIGADGALGSVALVDLARALRVDGYRIASAAEIERWGKQEAIRRFVESRLPR